MMARTLAVVVYEFMTSAIAAANGSAAVLDEDSAVLDEDGAALGRDDEHATASTAQTAALTASRPARVLITTRRRPEAADMSGSWHSTSQQPHRRVFPSFAAGRALQIVAAFLVEASHPLVAQVELAKQALALAGCGDRQ